MLRKIKQNGSKYYLILYISHTNTSLCDLEKSKKVQNHRLSPSVSLKTRFHLFGCVSSLAGNE